MSTQSQIARPYAKALFQLAREQSTLPAWSQALAQLAGVVSDNSVGSLLSHPRVDRSELVEALAPVMGKDLGDLPTNFLSVLAEQRRLEAIPEIKAQFDALRAEAERVVAVDITTAETVDADRQRAFAESIAKRLDRQVAIEWSTDARLIGGAVIRAEDMVIDGSVRGELEQLQKQIGQ